MGASQAETLESALAHAVRSVPLFGSTDRVADVRRTMSGREYASATHVVVCDGEEFRGLFPIERLLAAPDDQAAGSLTSPEAVVVTPGVDQEVAAWRAAQARQSTLAVVDDEGRFQGVVPPQALLSVLLHEHEEDLSRLAGVLRTTAEARASSEEPVPRRFVHRLPWLLIGLAGAIFAADIVSWFESQLRELVTLAYFIPGIVYLADAVGTQTETIVVRGLSVGSSMRRMMVREVLAGLAIAVALAVIAGPVVLLRWSDPTLAWIVAASLAGACSVAALVAMVLPLLFHRFDMDPAFGSGPLATVVQDLLSILIYFGAALALLG